MPFQSEKQRRYLWANEPEIARDWTDTYGSRIQAASGGISQLVKSGPGRPGYGGPHETWGGGAEAGRDPSSSSYSGGNQGNQGNQGGQHHHTGGNQSNSEAVKLNKKKQLKELALKDAENKQKDVKQLSLQDKFKLKSSDHRKKELRKLFDYIHGGRKLEFPSWGAIARKADWDDEDYLNWNPLGTSLHGDMSEKDLQKLSDIKEALGYSNLSQTGKFKGDNKFAFEDFYPNMNQHPGGGGGDGQGGGYMGYPSYEAWKAAQGTGATAAVPPELSAFQQSLTASANNPFDYYVGTTPGAQNLAWGKQMGVDPRTMGLTSFAADGGRIGRAYGGIMDSSTGRRAYGLGSIFKSVKKAAGKVLKSPIGKAALLGAGAYFGPMAFGQSAGFGNWANVIPKKGFMANMLRKNIAAKGDPFKAGGLDPWKLGIGALTALPFFMGGEKEDDDDKFDYMDAKTKYQNEIMRLRKGVHEGTLNPHQWSYLPSNYTYTGKAEGGRIGLEGGGDPLLREEYEKYVFEMKEMGIAPMSFEEFAAQARAGMYAGGQSTPSDYTMEDAMMTTTQDKLGGITDVMKQADLNRQGSVGQYYAANGGRIGYAGGSGKPPITMGQAPQAPQMPGPQAPQRPNPMPAPQPNRMAGMNPMMGGMPGGMHPMMNPMMGGMNPMMGRPMMRGMPARRKAQEGGLMDLGGMEKDYRNDGGFVPIGEYEKKDDVPARLSKNEFVFTADAVRGAGGGDIDKGAEIMENIMKNLEQGGKISEETQGLSGAQEMFGVSERLSEVV